MFLLWSLVWGIAVIIVMCLEICLHFPVLAQKKQRYAAPNKADAGKPDEEEAKVEKNPLASRESKGHFGFTDENRYFTGIVLAFCTLFAAWCGYRASFCGFSAFSMAKGLLTCCVLACVLVTDWQWMIIPNSCVLTLIGGRIVIFAGECFQSQAIMLLELGNSVFAAVLCLIILLIMHRVTRGGIGLGDVKLFCGISFLCGLTTAYYTLLLAFFSCALVSTMLLFAKKRRLKDWIPLGPFVYFGFGLAIILNIA